MRIKDYTDTIRHLTDPFNIPEARRMIQENPALTQEQFKAGGIVEPGVTHYARRGGGKQESLRVLEYLETLPKGTELSIQNIMEWSKKNNTEVDISSLYKNINTPERLATPELKKRWQDINKKLKINIRPQFTLIPTEENFKKLGKLLKDKSLTKDDIKKAFGLKPKSSTESFNNLLKAYEKSRKVKIPDTRFKPYRHKGTELAEKIIKTFKADDTMTVTALTEKFFPGRPEQRKSVIKILKEVGVREPQPLKKLTGPKTTEQIMSQRRRDKLKEKSVPAYEKKIRGTKNAHLHHMMSKRFNVTTRNLGYAPPRVNAELLPKVEGVLESLYKKRENLLKKRPSDLIKQLEDINVRGMNLVSDPKVKGYLNFKIMDSKTLKMSDYGVNLAKTIDPLDLLEGKAIKDLTQADKDLIELNRAAIMKRETGPRAFPKVKKTPLSELMQRQGTLMDPVLAGRTVMEETGGLLKGAATKFPKTTAVLKSIFETRSTPGAVFWAAEAPLLMLQGTYDRYANERDFKKALKRMELPDQVINQLGEVYGQELADIGQVGLESWAVDQPDTFETRKMMTEQMAEKRPHFETHQAGPLMLKDFGQITQSEREMQDYEEQLKQQEIEKRTREAYEKYQGRRGRREGGIMGLKK